MNEKLDDALRAYKRKTIMFKLRFTLKHLLQITAIVAVSTWLVFSFYPLGTLFGLLFGIVCVGSISVYYRKNAIALLSMLLATGVVIVGVPAVVMTYHPVPLHLINRIQPGMQKNEVQATLGLPTQISDGYWEYSSITWCLITVHFTADNKVDYVDHDH